MLLALGLQAEFSLKFLHDSCGLRLMPNVGQQCSESHAQHQHSKQQQNIGARIHNDMDIAGSSLCILDMYRVVRKSEQESALLAGKPLKDGTRNLAEKRFCRKPAAALFGFRNRSRKSSPKFPVER